MKNFNHKKLALVYLISLSFIMLLTLTISIVIKQKNLFISIVILMMFLFDISFFFLPFCFKKYKYPYISYEWQEPEKKYWLKHYLVWYFVIPVMFNFLALIILLLLANEITWVFITSLVIMIIILSMINISFIFCAIKFNRSYIAPKEINFDIRNKKRGY